MGFEEVSQYLRDAMSNHSSRNSKPFLEFLAATKSSAVVAKDEGLAKTIWCLEQMLRIQDRYIEGFYQLKAGKFYDGWCSFEKVDNGIVALARHYTDTSGELHIDFISKHTSQYLSIYPYKLFISPELVEIEKRCSICNKIVSIRTSCGHRVGDIYGGEMCGRVVTKWEPLGVAFVTHPVQKYSVPFLSDSTGGGKKDHYNYSVPAYLIERLESPFHAWEVEWTTRRHPHSRYSHVGRNEPCPCESGKKYKRCCSLQSGVLRPHCQFTFHVVPPPHLLTVEYSY